MARTTRIPAQERRAMILSLAERLIVERGTDVSTRIIAETAGIAEATIFRVFPTKEAIIDAIFEDAFNHEGFREAIAAIDPARDLEARMTMVVTVIRRIGVLSSLPTQTAVTKPPV